MEDGQVISCEGSIDERYPPCSSFKVALSLMGFDSGILHEAHDPVWHWREEYVEQLPGVLERWKQPHDPALWLINSCVWYSQVLTQKMGKHQFNEYVNRLGYGNCDIAGDPGKDNGLTHCWLMSSLKITPLEQAEFLTKLVNGELPLSAYAQKTTCAIMSRGRLDGEWKLYGKTGSGTIEGMSNGWFVGWITNGERVIVFAQHILEKEIEGVYGSSVAIERALQNLNSLLRILK